MKQLKLPFVLVFIFTIASPTLAATPSTASNKPDFTKGQAIPPGATHDWNLGPTGARGWMYSNEMETSEARQILITSIDKGSPASTVLEKNDVILGVTGTPFSFDPRTEFGRAVTVAESSRGLLNLIRWRAGHVEDVTIQLSVLGSYSETAPFECRKSANIFANGCDYIAKQMQKKPDRGNPIERCLNALALLASGNKTYWPLIRYQAAWASHFSDPERRTLHSWYYGPINMLLAEYTAVTGDTQFMPDINRITMEIVNGQSPIGSWGHRFTQANGRLAGYGMMNAPGLPLTVSLVLARNAGVHHPKLDAAISKSTRLLRFYVGKGSIPYGDHHPWMETHDDNGKNGIGAVLFNLLDDREAVDYFSRMSIASYGAERDSGHTGNFFNMLWAMPGIALSGPHATGAWLNEFSWYYDLARCWDGSFKHQGPPKEKPDSYNKWDCTGAYLLAFAQPHRATHLTGKKATIAQQITKQEAADFIADGQGWSPRIKNKIYSDYTNEALLDKLSSWSPIVRERSSVELAKREGDFTPKLIELLTNNDLNGKLGACQALAHQRDRGVAAIPALRSTLHANDLWLRIKSADALAQCGNQAMIALPDMLRMITEVNEADDPRGMLQRYLCFTLFDRRDGMLGRSLDGVDRDALFAAVESGLCNEDGRARGSFKSVFLNLEYEEIKPLLPAIYKAVKEPAPSGIMFADGIRLAGLEILAKHHIIEGIPLCISLIDIERWGFKDRISRCLNSLKTYGGSAKSELVELKQLETTLIKKGWETNKIKALDIPAIIHAIEIDNNPPTLQSIHSQNIFE